MQLQDQPSDSTPRDFPASPSAASDITIVDTNAEEPKKISCEVDEKTTVTEEKKPHEKALQYPVVFLHAFADIPGWSGTWKAVEDVLWMKGVEWFSVQMPMGGSIEARSTSAIEQIAAKYPNQHVHLFGHCLGGFNARDIASKAAKADLGFTVKTVTTFSTPHYGNKVLDMVPDSAADGAMATIRKAFGYDLGEVLSERYVKNTFNPQTPDNPDVHYFSWAADTVLPTTLTAAPWLITRPFGPTDGLVNCESAKWGTHLGTVKGLDHFSIIGRLTVEGTIPHLQAAEKGTKADVEAIDETYAKAMLNRTEGAINFALGLPRALLGF